MPFGIVVLLSMMIACCPSAAAQPERQSRQSSSSIWLAYAGEHAVSQLWNLHLEGQFFSYGPIQRPELTFLRPGFRRDFSHGVSALVTYAYFMKFPAVTGASKTLSEHRVAEDIQWRHPVLGEGIRRVTLTHRLRAEQRFEAEENQGSGSGRSFAERFRYRLTANVPLPGNTAAARPDYLSLYDEVFINFGPHGGSRALDQNIVAGAVGWNLTSKVQFEIGYLLQYNPTTAGALGTYNHAVQININSTLPFSETRASR